MEKKAESRSIINPAPVADSGVPSEGVEFQVVEQRYLPRWETDSRVYYHCQDGHVISRTRLRNLNASGACLYVGKDVCIQQRLELKVYLAKEKSFETAGTVRWIHQSPKHLSWAGVVFNNLSPEQQELILGYAFDVR